MKKVYSTPKNRVCDLGTEMQYLMAQSPVTLNIDEEETDPTLECDSRIQLPTVWDEEW